MRHENLKTKFGNVIKCSKCGTKDKNKYRFMKFLEDGKIYCEVCVSDFGDVEMHEWLQQNFRELE